MVASVIASAGLGIAADIVKNIVSDAVVPDGDKKDSIASEIIDAVVSNDHDEIIEEIEEIEETTAAPATTTTAAALPPDDVASFYNGLAMGNAISNQQAHQQLQLAITSKIVESIITTSPSGGSNNDNTLQLMELLGNIKNT